MELSLTYEMSHIPSPTHHSDRILTDNSGARLDLGKLVVCQLAWDKGGYVAFYVANHLEKITFNYTCWVNCERKIIQMHAKVWQNRSGKMSEYPPRQVIQLFHL